jgi:hypothetical protein
LTELTGLSDAGRGWPGMLLALSALWGLAVAGLIGLDMQFVAISNNPLHAWQCMRGTADDLFFLCVCVCVRVCVRV